jgi:hypothetical protein
MSYPDFSNIFPSPNINYPCTFNPNSGYATDCVGTTQTSSETETTSSATGGNGVPETIGNKQIAVFANNVSCTYDPTKSPPLDCRDKYCHYYYKTNLLGTTGFNPPDSHPPDKIVCNITGNICTYDPLISPKLICDDQQCKYLYNDHNLLKAYYKDWSNNTQLINYNLIISLLKNILIFI